MKLNSAAKDMDTVTQLLGLEEFEAVEVQEEPRRRLRRIVVIPRVTAGLCPQCHKATQQRHQVRDRIVRDLPMGACQIELVVRQPQYRCLDCQVCFTPGYQALNESAHATERFLERMAAMLASSDVKNAATFFGVPEKTVEGWYYAYLERRVDQAAAEADQPIRSLGIDEISRKKSADVIAAS